MLILVFRCIQVLYKFGEYALFVDCDASAVVNDIRWRTWLILIKLHVKNGNLEFIFLIICGSQQIVTTKLLITSEEEKDFIIVVRRVQNLLELGLFAILDCPSHWVWCYEKAWTVKSVVFLA